MHYWKNEPLERLSLVGLFPTPKIRYFAYLRKIASAGGKLIIGTAMPDKPIWCGHLDAITLQLRQAADPWVDRALLESVLRIGRRRAQQLLAPCVSRKIGANGVADCETVIAHLRQLASGEAVHYEHQRRRQFAARMEALDRERKEGVPVEAPVSIVNQRLEGLPEGVLISPGKITVAFTSPTEALQKLLALAMAIGNDQALFERLAAGE